VVLSHKHKPTDKDEKERIRAAGGHVVFGRLFGDLAVSRSLGDPDYKKPLSEVRALLIDPPRPRTHPVTHARAQANYISAEPHVSATELLTDKDEFLIIGCDGVWDVVNYQEVRLSKAFFFFSVHCRHNPHCLFRC
jgi:serine/threonine protein phosphatase PrpC